MCVCYRNGSRLRTTPSCDTWVVICAWTAEAPVMAAWLWRCAILRSLSSGSSPWTCSPSLSPLRPASLAGHRAAHGLWGNAAQLQRVCSPLPPHLGLWGQTDKKTKNFFHSTIYLTILFLVQLLIEMHRVWGILFFSYFQYQPNELDFFACIFFLNLFCF